ncbi:2711_t:CDS:2, partial [Racocetra persica]
KHGSDSETFDSEGRFVPEKFEEIFSKYDREFKGGLSFGDIQRLIYGNANACDPFGWTSTIFEWGILFLLCAQNGIVSKEDVRSSYDQNVRRNANIKSLTFPYSIKMDAGVLE